MPNFFLKYYLPAFIWAGVIFYFSSIGGLGYSQDIKVETILRKGAHFVEYAILAFLIWRIFYGAYKLSPKKSFGFSFLLVLLYAASDEWHQSFVFARSGKIADVFYDALSALIILEIILISYLKKKNTKVWVGLFLTVASLIFLEYRMIENAIKTSNISQPAEIFPEDKTQTGLAGKSSQDENVEHWTEEKKDEKKKNPKEIFIQVPFTSQAPFAVWDEYHEEACEEASLVMLKYYLDGKKITPEIAEKEIQGLIAYQIENYGDYKDTSAEETVKLAEDFYGIENLKVIYDFSWEDLKKYLARERPIIIPAAGRMLGNPFFTAPGPLYHNLILVGYTEDKFITNDPGTKRGEGYEYDINILCNAIHDFSGDKNEIEKGRKAMIIIE